MNAVERLEAAIQKLEALKAGAAAGPWHVSDDGEYIYNGGPAQCPIESRENAIGYFVLLDDAPLIVTLHRTIDAQLAFLRAEAESIRLHIDAMVNAAGRIYLEPGPFYNKPKKAWRHIERQRADVLALADAILGGA